MTTTDTAALLTRLHERDWSRLVGALTRLTRDPDLAEEAVSDAYAAALRRWPVDGPPSEPAAWLHATARNRVLDRYRRDQRLAARIPALGREAEHYPTDRDELGLLFACCHPALGMPARVAVTLRLVGGLETAQIARLFLVAEATVAQRIVRAKRRLRDGDLTLAVPPPERWAERLDAVLAVLYLVFTEGYAPSDGPDLVRPGLCEEALRLAERLPRLLPDEPEPVALVALMRLQHSRRDARTGSRGQLVRLAEQDRTRWDRADIGRGIPLTERALRLGRRAGRPGPYQIQAAIAAVHAEAEDPAATDWDQIVALYGVLFQVAPSPIAELNRAIAVAEAGGDPASAEKALALLTPLGESLVSNHLHHAARAELLRRGGRVPEAIAALRRAHELARTTPERRHLATQLDELIAR